MTVVVGADLSLTATGLAIARPAGTGVLTVKSKGSADASLGSRNDRLRRVCAEVMDTARGADLVVIEQPAYSQTGGSHHDRSGLWWLLVSKLLAADIPVVEVSPTAVKKYGTGRGNAGKDEVLAAVVRRYPTVIVTNNNEADALLLAAMGARSLGFALEGSLPVAHELAMSSVAWPETASN